jgi:hypothetical protein
MGKGIATQTILLMLVGIIVVGIIIYIVYRSLTGPSLSEGECRARMINACMMCENVGWDKDYGVAAELHDPKICAKGIFAYWDGNEQCKLDNMEIDCAMLGVS